MSFKTTLLTCLILAFAIKSKCQEKTNSISIHQAAYTYILRSPEFKGFAGSSKCVAVFDSAVYLDRVTFNKQFDFQRKHINNYRESTLIDSLDRLDLVSQHKPFFSSHIAILTRNSIAERDCIVVFFSTTIDNWLMAEVVWNEGGGKSHKQIMPVFGQSLRYLLFFDRNHKIENASVQYINYN